MDSRLKSIIDNFDAMKIGLDDTFHFGCRQCGKCCINREDIFLNAKDVYNLCNALSLTPGQVMKQYCEVYIGQDSRLPIVRLKPQGSIKRCPLLKDRKCSVHNLKPAVCAMYPIGRAIRIDTCEAGSKDLQTLTPVYLYNKTACGDASESHTVREWLTMFGIPVNDPCFSAWHRIILNVSQFVRKAEKKLPGHTMTKLWELIHAALYLFYNPCDDFLPQFQANSHKLLALLKDIPLE